MHEIKILPVRSLAPLGISPAGSDVHKTAQVRIPPSPPDARNQDSAREVPRATRDLACGLRRPQNGSSSNPSLSARFYSWRIFSSGPSKNARRSLLIRTGANFLLL